MKIYPPEEGFTAEEMRRGVWSLYVDVKCEGCKADYSAPQVGGIGGSCLRCGGRCS
jgi:hypothetical protein